MRKQIVKKIIKGITIFTFAVFLIQVVLPMQASAEIKLDWENPNKTGNNPYKIKTSDVLNSQMITQVVGCTGIADKVSTAIVDFAKDLLTRKAKAKVKTKVCSIAKKIGVTSGSSVPYVDPEEVIKLINCNEIQQTESPTQEEIAKEELANEKANTKREECLNGIAVTLARNQLTSMTRYTMNWVNSGFNGDPMYVRNITSFTNSLEKNVIETGVNILTTPDKAYPYGSDFSRSVITGYNSGSSLRTGANNFLNSLTSDLSNFITDPRSYYSEDNLTEADKANNTNDAFANDFSTGGWDGWLALTQRDQNNPLGFTMKASEFLQDQQMTQTQNAKEELATNDGFLSQKKCVKWIVMDEYGKPEMKETPLGSPKEKTTTRPDDNDVCAPDGYETITPGSIIKSKVDTYINSEARQLELVDTINESLNTLFGSLISKLINEGLSSITPSTDTNFTNTDAMIGYGNNDLSGNDSISLAGLGLDDNSTDSFMSGGFSNGSFDLTRDLGNTYIHNYTDASKLGNWDAGNNETGITASSLADRNVPSNLKLTQGVAPIGKDGAPLKNVYYNVIRPGLTIIVENDINKWESGDRAFWDGEKWQNWKCGRVIRRGKSICTNQMNPIKKKGILQIQKDYITSAKELLSVLPTIMPKIGELDYCIPGPNPNWQTNSGEAEGAFTDLAGTMKGKPQTRWRCPAGFHPNSLFSSYWSCGACCVKGLRYSRNVSYTASYVFSTAEAGTEEYDNYYQIFQNTAKDFWAKIKEGTYWTSFNARYSSLRATLTDQQIVDAAVKEVTKDIATFYKEYGDYINRTYGANSPMQKKFLENEETSELETNPAYLPMAQGGLDITKDIVSYDEDITEITETYKNSIIKANENINKLENIKEQVSVIIQAAQRRRDEKLMSEQGLTYEQYIAKYAICLEEEDIVYYDDFESRIRSDEALRCNDDMDNDLDGLVDDRDPDCKDETNGTCVINSGPTTAPAILNTSSCRLRTSRTECVAAPYYHNSTRTICAWIPN